MLNAPGIFHPSVLTKAEGLNNTEKRNENMIAARINELILAAAEIPSINPF